jgi:hypothetical protein
MSGENKELIRALWTADSVRDAIRKRNAVLKENPDGKADCWRKFRLVETTDGEPVFGWAACADCYCCVIYKSQAGDGTVKLYGTKNMTDHMKTCMSASTSGKQSSIDFFVKRVPGKKFQNTERAAIKNAEVHLVVEAGLSFAVVENSGLRSFAQQMILIGSKYGNVSVDEVLYGPHTVRDAVVDKMKECQDEVKRQVAASSKFHGVSFCTDMTTDDVNKNSYSDFTVFWVNDWKLKHALYKCENFPEKHTAQNIQKFIDSNLTELGLSLVDTPCTTDKGSNIVAATATKTHVDCSCHRLNTSIDTAWKKCLSSDSDLQQLDNFCHELVKYVNQASGIQSNLPTSLKHGGETRPWRSLTDMFTSIWKSREALVPVLREKKKEQLIARIDIDLLNDVVSFFRVFPSLFDILEYANIPTLQNSLPVYYTLYEEWQPQTSDGESTALMKTEFLKALTNKYWNSLNMLHFVATFLDPSLRDFLFVRNVKERQGFLKQVKESIHSMANQSTDSTLHSPEDSTLDTIQPSVSSVATTAGVSVNSPMVLEQPVNKKLKVDPFRWFRKVNNDSR